MPFQKMTIDDIPVIAPYFRFVTTNTCDFTVGGMFMWRDYFHMAWQVEDGVLYSTLTGEDGNLYYNLPLGEDIPAGLRQCLARHPERPVRFCTIPEADLPLFQELPGRVEITEEENFADYLYSAEEMIQLSGKKFSGQRNHISRFLRTCQSWSFEPLDSTDAAEVEAFFHTLNKNSTTPPERRQRKTTRYRRCWSIWISTAWWAAFSGPTGPSWASHWGRCCGTLYTSTLRRRTGTTPAPIRCCAASSAPPMPTVLRM